MRDDRFDSEGSGGEPSSPGLIGDIGEAGQDDPTWSQSTREPAALKRETPADKFARLGDRRLEQAIKSIESLAKLSSNNYQSTDEQRKFIVRHVDRAVSDLKQAMLHSSSGSSPRRKSLRDV